MLAPVLLVSAAWQPGPNVYRRTPAIRPYSRSSSAVGVAAGGEALEAQLLSMLDMLPNRGFFANKLQASAVLDFVNGMEDPSEQMGGWLSAEELLVRNWRLRYTSSIAFANNGGLTGFTRVQGVSTPELLMQVGASARGAGQGLDVRPCARVRLRARREEW